LGTAAKADYSKGMAVFIIAETGAMVDASIGGQKFSFVRDERELAMEGEY